MTRKPVYRLIGKVLICWAVVCFSAAAQDLYNRNLVANGNAEADSATTVPGWKTFGSFRVSPYSEGGITASDKGPADRGKQYFSAGEGAARSYAEQTISLNGLAQGARFRLSAFMGKNHGNQDPADMKLVVTFMDDKGQTIQETVLRGPDNLTEYNIPGGLHPRAVSGFLLPNVTQARLTLDFGAVDSSGNVLAADNIALTLSRDPMTGVNVVSNGNLEATPAGAPVGGWNGSLDSLEVKDYSSNSGLWDLRTTSPGPATRGKNYMLLDVGGDADKQQKIWQVLEVTRNPYLAVIDAGQMRYKLDGWLGVAGEVRDEIKMRLTFLDGKAAAATLGTAETTTVIGKSGEPGLQLVSAGGGSAVLPNGTRRIMIEIVLTKRSTVVDDMIAYADEIALVMTAPPQITIEGVGNAASYASGKVSPGEILVVYGTDFGPASVSQYTVSNGLFTTTSGETRVLFDGVPAPMIYSVSGQLSCIVPYSVAGKQTTQVQAEYQGSKGNVVSIPVAAAVPGLFTLDQTGKNQLAALNQDYSINGPSKPADRGSVVMLYGTGEGATSPVGVDGKVASGVYPKPLTVVTAQVGGMDAEVLYYGAAPDLVAGVIQVNVKIPAAVTPGSSAVVIRVGEQASQSGATLTVK